MWRLGGWALWLLHTASAFALTAGEPPSVLARETVFGSAVVIGNTLMEHDGTTNFALRVGGSQANLSSNDFPPDARVVRAFLFWSGSLDPAIGVDRDVDFRLPDGTFYNDLSVSFPVAGESPSDLNRCVSQTGSGAVPDTFFACRREVTELLQRLGTGAALGTYEVNDLDARPGDCTTNPSCQAMYGGWALVVMWEAPTHPIRRDLVLYDAFYVVDEQNNPFSSGISPEFRLDGFLVGDTADAELTFVGFEGDAQLGTPPQNISGNPLFCNTCADFIDLRRSGSTTRTRLSDPSNQPGNLFNGSNNAGGGPHPGLDIDRFDIGATGLNVVRSGDSALWMRVGSGDGTAGGANGSGEMVFLGLTLLAIDTLSPRFSNDATEKVVLEPVAGSGETLNYILRIENDGAATAENAIIRDQLPSGVTYEAGSTTNTCGVSSGDIGGVSPVLSPSGLSIGNVAPGARCEVRFRVRVNSGLPDGTVIQNYFTVAADNHPVLQVGPATTTLVGARIGQPTKRVTIVGGGAPTPGTTLAYSIRIPNEGTRPAPSVSVQDVLPPELEFTGFIGSLPPGSTNNSEPGAGRIQIDDINIAPDGFVEVSFFARIRDAVPAGSSIVNQAEIAQPSFGTPLLSDDPLTPVTPDPTVVLVESGVSLAASSKTGVDLDGGRLLPGDVIEYRIRVRQLGNQSLVVDLVDELPAFVGNCNVVTLPPGSFASCQSGGTNGTGRVTGVVAVGAGQTQELVLQVTVSALAPDGARIVNRATLTPSLEPDARVEVTSPELEVFARPIFITSTKSVSDLNGGDARPGDALRYRITVQNSGPVTATNVQVTDEVDSRLVALAPESGGAAVGQLIRWTIPTLAPSAEATLEFVAVIAPGTENGAVIRNEAGIAADPPAEAFVTPVVEVAVRAEPELRFEKQAFDLNGPPYRPGDRLLYRIRVENVGDGTANRVQIRDALPSQLTAVSLPQGGILNGSEVVFDEATVPGLLALRPGEQVNLDIEATLDTPLANGLNISNQAVLTSDEQLSPLLSDDPTTPTPADPTAFAIVSQARARMTKRYVDLDGGALLPGDAVEFILQIENDGDAPLTMVQVQDPLDSRLQFVSSADGGTDAGGTVSFTSTSTPELAAIEPGVPAELRFVARIATGLPNGSTIANQARLRSPDHPDVLSDDPTTSALNDPTVLVVESRPVLDEFVKRVIDTDLDGVFEPGDLIRYELVVTNSGSEPAVNVRVRDALPSELVDVVAPNGGVVFGNEVTWDPLSLPALASVAVGQRVTLIVEAKLRRPLDDDVVISNQATLTADGTGTIFSDDPSSALNDDPTRFVVSSSPLLRFEKRVRDANGAPFEPGDLVEYELRLWNAGNRAAASVTVTDVLDSSLEAVTAQNGGSLVGRTLTWSPSATPELTQIEVDEEVILGFTAAIVRPLANGTAITNQAWAEVGESGVSGNPFGSDDPSTPGEGDPTVIQVVSASDLTATTLESLDLNGTPITTRRPGEAVEYVLLVQNQGKEAARNVRITVPFGPELTFISSTAGTFGAEGFVVTSASVPDLSLVNPGDVVEIRFRARLQLPLDDGTPISLQAELTEEGLVSPVRSDDPSTSVPGDETRLLVVAEPRLSVFEKRYVDENGAPVEPGDVIQYVLRIENTGDAAARDVVVEDVLPSEMEFVSSDTGGTVVGSRVLFTGTQNPALVEMIPATPVELRFRVRVRSTLPAGAVVANQASVEAAGVSTRLSDDPITPAVDDPTVFTVQTVARLSLEKVLETESGTRLLAPAENFTYAFSLRSNGSAPTGPFTFEDVLPAQLDDVVVEPGITWDAVSGRLSLNVSTLNPGETRAFRVRARVAAGTANGTRIENQARATGLSIGTVLSDDPATAAEADPTIAIVEASPDLSAVTKVAVDENGGTLLPGDTVRYVISIPNAGNGPAQNVTVTDPIDLDKLEIIEISQGGQAAGGVIVWEPSATAALSSIAPGASVELSFTARVRTEVRDNDPIDNQASVQAQNIAQPLLSDDPTTSTVDDPTRILVRTPVLAFTKRLTDLVGPTDQLQPADRIRYEITVTNRGSWPATDVVIRDELPTELIDVQVFGGGRLSGSQVIYDDSGTPGLREIAPGESVTVRIEARIDPLTLDDTRISNQATLTYSEGPTALLSDDPATPSAEDATVRTVFANEVYAGEVSLFDVESGAPLMGSVVPGQEILARVSFGNVGTQTGRGGVLRLPFEPARFRVETASDGGIIDAANDLVSWDASQNAAFAYLAPDESFTVEVTGRIASPIPDQLDIPVSAYLQTLTTSERFDFGPAVMTVRSRPDLSASLKEVLDLNGGQVEPGDVLRYRITVLNDGGAEANDVQVIDIPPAGTTYIPNTTSVGGLPVGDNEGTTPLVRGLSLGDLSASRAQVVSFDVRVSLDALRGFVISNQAALETDDGLAFVSDDPRTPLIIGDPTVVVVGGGPFVQVAKTVDPPRAAPGDRVMFSIHLENSGSREATGIRLEDVIEAGLRFVPGSTTLNGASRTDADDGDGVTFSLDGVPTLQFSMDRLEPGDGVTLAFQTEIVGVGSAQNQAQWISDGGALSLSDGDPIVPGAQPTRVQIGEEGTFSIAPDGVELRDVNGGSLDATDTVVARIVVRNQGAAAARVEQIRVNVSALFEPEVAELPVGASFDANTRIVRFEDILGGPLAPGDARTFSFAGRVSDQARRGERIRVLASTNVTSVDLAVREEVALGSAEMTVGLLPGTGGVEGNLYYESKPRDGRFDAERDVRAEGFTLLAYREGADSADGPVRTVVSDARGYFSLDALPAGSYVLHVVSDTGVEYRRFPIDGLAPGEIREQDIRIDPSGVVYQSLDFAPVPGARITLYHDDGDDDPSNDEPVAAASLGPGQQGQVTTRLGLYRFDAPAGDYRIGIEGPDALSIFPSGKIAPEPDDAGAHPLGAVARPDEDGLVVPHARPDTELAQTYFLRFRLGTSLPPVLNNHIPLDRLQDDLRIVKTANRKSVSVGDIVSYSVRLENRSHGVLELTEGGVEIVDALPEAFRLIPNAWKLERIELDALGQERRSSEENVDVDGTRLLRVGPFSLQAHTSYEFRYQVVIGPGATNGEAENRARLRTAAGQIPLTEIATAVVRIIPEEMFDLGSIRGKVFHDADQDGWQDADEVGLGGVRLYLDTGYYADADLTGKFHFTRVPPGMHVVKMDERTLPPGCEVRGGERSTLYISAGLAAQVSFAARCEAGAEGPSEIEIRRDAYEPPDTPSPEVGLFAVRATLQERAVLIGEKRWSLPRVDLGVGLEGDEPAFSGAPGPNSNPISADGLPRLLVFSPRYELLRPIVGWQLAITESPHVSSEVMAGEDNASVRQPMSNAGSGSTIGADTPAATPGNDAPTTQASEGTVDPLHAPSPLYVFSGSGAPPHRIPWDGREATSGRPILQAGMRYHAVLHLVLEDGDEVDSAPRPFGVAFGARTSEAMADPPLMQAIIDEEGGPLFVGDAEPSPRLLSFLRQQVPALQNTDRNIVVEAHLDARPDQATEAKSARQALAVAGALVQAGIAKERLMAEGVGDKRPKRPNLREADRKKNRRIELRSVSDVTPYAAIAARVAQPALWIQGQALPLDVSDAYQGELSLPTSGPVVVEVTLRDGTHARIWRHLTPDENREPAAEAASKVRGEALVGSFRDQVVKFGGRAYPLTALGLSVRPEQLTDGSIVYVDDAVEEPPRILFQLAVPEATSPTSWKLRMYRVAAEAESTASQTIVGDEARDAGGEGAPVLGDEGRAPPAADRAPMPDASSLLGPGEQLVLVQELRGQGRPDRQVTWDATTTDGGRIDLQGSSYVARLILEFEDGTTVISKDQAFDVRVGASTAATGEQAATWLIEDPGEADALTPDAVERLQAVARAVMAGVGALRIEAHTDDQGPRFSHRARSQQVADRARAVLIAAGVASERISSVGMGSDRPKGPNINARARRANRRLELVWTREDSASPGEENASYARVLANGRPMSVNGTDFSGEVPASSSGEVSLLVQSPSGARGVFRFRPEVQPYWQGRYTDLDRPLEAMREAWRKTLESRASLTPALATDGGVPIVLAADAGEGAPVSFPEEGDPPSWWPRLPAVQAADLWVSWPRGELVARGEHLFIQGRTHPANVVQIQGQDILVDADTGRFSTLVALDDGVHEVVVESVDVVGNRARIRKNVAVDTSGWFALLLGDVAIGGDGAHLTERETTTSFTMGDAFVYGRGAAYVKGKFQGQTLFRDYELTLHLDTRRWDELAFARDVMNPDLAYPVFGDSSVEIQEAQARYPLYLQLNADMSTLRVGNLRTGMAAGDLFRYDRSRYGLRLHFDRGWSQGITVDDQDATPAAPQTDPWRTQASAFVTGGAQNQRHARVELMGTGGSVYFLRHGFVAEGSERVSILVRDAITGMEIARLPRSRNFDYTVRYTEGRIVFSEPLPAFTDMAFSTNHNLGQVRAGHRIYVEVEYNHDDIEPFMGTGAGLQLTQRLFGQVELGAGYVFEGREDGSPGYQLGGMQAKWFLDDLTFVKAEWAWSESVDAGNFISLDGGLTYRSLGQSLDQKAVQVGSISFSPERHGYAFKVEGQTAFGQWFLDNPRDGIVRTYVQALSPGFFAGASIVEQGQLKWGGDANLRLTGADQLRLRYDGSISEVPEIPHVSEMRTLHREIATLQYERQILPGLLGKAEYGYGYTADSGSFGNTTFPVARDFHTNVTTLAFDWQALDELAVGARQEVILSGDPNQLQSWSDHLVSHLQLRYRLTEQLSLTGSESLRWSGENQTALGVAWQISDTARIYANERFGFAQQGFTQSTVVGGETQLTDASRAYAEYQLQGAFSAPQSRGLVGLANRWKLPFGITLSFGYERTQTFGGEVTTTPSGAVPPGAFTDGTLLAAPGANGGGDYFYGAMARDAVSGGLEYTRDETIRFSQRLELRLDDFDETRGGRDRTWLMSMTNAAYRFSPELALMARYNIGLAQDLAASKREAYLEEGVLGVAYRPITHDWVSVLGKLSRRVEVRPISLEQGRMDDYTVHAFSVEPIVELPWAFQLSMKTALKHVSHVMDTLPRADAVTGLALVRLNWHALTSLRSFEVEPGIPGDIDLGLEYRSLAGFTAARIEHGVLVEVQYAPVSSFRLGLGWNFTHFSDDELARDDRDYGGFFVRGVGQF